MEMVKDVIITETAMEMASVEAIAIAMTAITIDVVAVQACLYNKILI
jgi:hypothetical protein